MENTEDKNIIDFQKVMDENDTRFLGPAEFVNDPYIISTIVTALRMSGFEPTKQGVIEFQTKIGMDNPQGYIDYDTIYSLIQVFSPEDTQEISNYINRVKIEASRKSAKNPNDEVKTSFKTNLAICIATIYFLIVVIVGQMTIINHVISFFKN